MLVKFEKLVKEKREINLAEVKENLKNIDDHPDLKEKINNYSERHGLPLNYVYDRLKYSDDDMIFLIFEKDPTRQNIYEKIQLLFVKQIQATGLIEGVKKLPANGDNTLFIKDGEIRHLSGEDTRILKSLDFYWKYEFSGKKLEFYTSCKYTKETGGAQDNQGIDVIATIDSAKEVNNNNLFIIALLDGKYYNQINASWNSMNFYNYTNSDYPNCRYLASNCDNLFEAIKTEIKRWLNSLEDIDQELINNEIERIDSISFEYQDITVDEL